MESRKLGQTNTVSVVGIGYRGGQPKIGVEHGPTALREAGVINIVKELGWNVEDTGNLKFAEFDPESDKPVEGVKFPRQVGKVCETIYNEVKQYSAKKNTVLNLGGDHSLAIGTIAATASAWPDVAVIWVDAHADINSPKTSTSGNIHGMPVGFLMGIDNSLSIPGFQWLKPCLTPDRIVYIGLRDVDPGEKGLLKKYNIKCFSMTEVDRYGIGEVMRMAIDHVSPKRDRPIHLSFDVDGIDPSEVPSTGTTVKGGLSYREARYLCESVSETGLLVAMDIVEVNPSLGTGEQAKQTAAVAVELARSAFGQKLL